jgi:hypothetical protein
VTRVQPSRAADGMRFLACAILALTLASAPVGAGAREAPIVLAEDDRSIGEERAVLVTLAQDRIETSFELGRVAPNMSGGLLDTLIIASRDNRREILSDTASRQAESTVRPLREALNGFDVDALASAATRAALAGVTWFRPQEIRIGKDESTRARYAFGSSVNSPQLAFLTYRYDLSPDFTQIRVFADITVARKAKGGRLVILMEQRLASIAQLARRSYDHRENVAAWRADDGALAQAALTSAFAQFEWLVPKALELREPEVISLTDTRREKAFAAGLYGPLVERGRVRPDDVLLWSGGLVFVQTMP